MSDPRPNVICPNENCCQGSVDTGIVTSCGPVTDICPICKGYGFVTAEEMDEVNESRD